MESPRRSDRPARKEPAATPASWRTGTDEGSPNSWAPFSYGPVGDRRVASPQWSASGLRKEGLQGPGGGVRSLSDLEAFSEGTVGWGMTRFTLSFPDGSSVSPRWSAVFHREDGEWKFVQLHASIGVANEESGWVPA